jgi:UDP-N-acetylglucosamine transferase subunit ALG13
VTTILVASSGGHLSELVELAPRIDGLGDDLWITFDSPQSRSLLEGRRTAFVGPIKERDVLGVCREVASAHKILRGTNVSAVISTGSGIALSFLPYAAVRKIPAHYIESATFVDAPGLTGRVLERVPGVQLYRQYQHAWRGRWKYIGSVFDGFQATDSSRRKVHRVVVTLGSGRHGYRRLLDRLVAILPPHIEVLWQTGSTPVDGLPIEAQRMVPAAQLEKAIREADAVIGHAGCGTALSALNAGKYPVLVAREARHGELIDNHQVELARFLGERDLALNRTPETISLDDVDIVAARNILRDANPPALRLAQPY